MASKDDVGVTPAWNSRGVDPSIKGHKLSQTLDGEAQKVMVREVLVARQVLQAPQGNVIRPKSMAFPGAQFAKHFTGEIARTRTLWVGSIADNPNKTVLGERARSPSYLVICKEKRFSFPVVLMFLVREGNQNVDVE